MATDKRMTNEKNRSTKTGKKRTGSSAAGVKERKSTGSSKRRVSEMDEVRVSRSTQSQGKGKRKNSKKKKKTKYLLFALEAVVLVVLCLVLVVMSKISKVQNLDVKPEDIAKNDLEESVLDNMNGYMNIALFGIDTRKIGDLGKGNRSDTMMIASINKETKEVKLVSVYRDTYLNLANDKYGKCNAAYSYGGPQQAISMLNMNLDLNIDYYVSVDFMALAKTVDALGGIEVDVDEVEMKYLNDYIYETSEVTGLRTTFLTEPGLQTLDGVQATSYCRIRQTAGDDFKRTERQKEVLQIIADKAKTASLSQINEIINEVFPLIATNLTLPQMISMASDMMEYTLSPDTYGFPAERDSAKINKQSMVIPKTLENNVKELHKFLFGEDDYYPSSTIIKIDSKISSDTGVY